MKECRQTLEGFDIYIKGDPAGTCVTGNFKKVFDMEGGPKHNEGLRAVARVILDFFGEPPEWKTMSTGAAIDYINGGPEMITEKERLKAFMMGGRR